MKCIAAMIDISTFCPTPGYPVPGFYGHNCSIPCSENCVSHCNIETGSCQFCKAGYQGNRYGQGNCLISKLELSKLR